MSKLQDDETMKKKNKELDKMTSDVSVEATIDVGIDKVEAVTIMHMDDMKLVKSTTPQQCRTCRFYKDPSCCLNPPVWRDYNKRYDFVKTVPHQWCGQWEVRNVK